MSNGDSGAEAPAIVLYDLKTVADYLEMSPETLRKKLRPHGTWPARRIGRQIKFTDADIATIVEMSAQPDPVVGVGRPRRAS